MSIKPVKKISEFILEEKYDTGKEGDTVTIKLIVDHMKEDFAIIPRCGTNDFRFRYNKGEHHKWKAILSLIDKAISVGNEKLIF